MSNKLSLTITKYDTNRFTIVHGLQSMHLKYTHTHTHTHAHKGGRSSDVGATDSPFAWWSVYLVPLFGLPRVYIYIRHGKIYLCLFDPVPMTIKECIFSGGCPCHLWDGENVRLPAGKGTKPFRAIIPCAL